MLAYKESNLNGFSLYALVDGVWAKISYDFEPAFIARLLVNRYLEMFPYEDKETLKIKLLILEKMQDSVKAEINKVNYEELVSVDEFLIALGEDANTEIIWDDVSCNHTIVNSEKYLIWVDEVRRSGLKLITNKSQINQVFPYILVLFCKCKLAELYLKEKIDLVLFWQQISWSRKEDIMNRLLNEIINVNYLGTIIETNDDSKLYSEVTFMYRNHLYYISCDGSLVDLTDEKDIKPSKAMKNGTYWQYYLQGQPIAAHKLVLLCKKFKAGDTYIGYLTYMSLHPEKVVNHTNVNLIEKNGKLYCKPFSSTAYNAKYLEVISSGENNFHGSFIRKWLLNGITITYKRAVYLENLFLKLDLDPTNLNDIKKARTLATYKLQ